CIDVAGVVGYPGRAGAAAVQHDNGWAATGFGGEDRFPVDGDGAFGQVRGGHALAPFRIGVMVAGGLTPVSPAGGRARNCRDSGAGYMNPSGRTKLPGFGRGVEESVGPHDNCAGLLAPQPADEGRFDNPYRLNTELGPSTRAGR